MKKVLKLLILSFFGFICTNLFSQEIKYTDLNGPSRPKGEFTSYVSKDGSVYKIGDKIKIGVPSSNKTFAFISEGDGILIPMTPLTARSSGQETAIKRMLIEGSKRTGFYVLIRSKGLTGLANYSIQLENAIETGEVKSFGMTSDEALSELKKSKDKLELGIITQAKYDSLKIEYSKFIK
jgi:hypothetical protein